MKTKYEIAEWVGNNIYSHSFIIKQRGSPIHIDEFVTIAKELDATNTNCNDCINCIECNDCVNCNECHSSSKCDTCYRCYDCIHCTQCNECYECYHCTNCVSCEKKMYVQNQNDENSFLKRYTTEE